MNELITVERLENELVRLCGLLEDATETLRPLCYAEGDTESDYRKAKAIAYQSATGPVAERQAQVDKVCNEDLRKRNRAAAEKDAHLEYIRSLRAQLDAWRTLAASHRSETEMAGRNVQKVAFR